MNDGCDPDTVVENEIELITDMVPLVNPEEKESGTCKSLLVNILNATGVPATGFFSIAPVRRNDFKLLR
jgi:hypothetical protein